MLVTNVFHSERVLFHHYFCFTNSVLGKLPSLSLTVVTWALDTAADVSSASAFLISLPPPSSVLPPPSSLLLFLSLSHIVPFLPSSPFPPFLSHVFGDRLPLCGPGWSWISDPPTQASGVVTKTLCHRASFLCWHICRYVPWHQTEHFLTEYFFWLLPFHFPFKFCLFNLLTCYWFISVNSYTLILSW